MSPVDTRSPAEPGAAEVLWYLTAPDGRYPWVPDGRWQRDTDLRHFQRVASTIDSLEFSGALVATTGPNDPFTFATALMPFTTRMKFLLAIYPGLITPRQLAHMALTFDNLSGGRLLINVVNGADEFFPPHGVHLSSEARYRLSTEYWTAFNRLYAGLREPFSGNHYRLAGTEQFNDAHWEWLPPAQHPGVPLWGAGGSPAGLKNAGQLLDVYLTFIDTPNQMQEKLQRAHAAAAAAGRSFKDCGVWISVIVRETEDEAWAVAQDFLAKTGADRIAASVDQQLRTQLATPGGLAEASSDDPTVQRLIETLRKGKVPDARDLEFYPPCGRARSTGHRRPLSKSSIPAEHSESTSWAARRRSLERSVNCRGSAWGSSFSAVGPSSTKPSGSPSCCYHCCVPSRRPPHQNPCRPSSQT